ncbi:hypothetical protein [Streptomyces marispadix]|uniref:Lipoprotein n=1 Tax=Streptomyces marispadix TaxID=2922868 RepID=A0ABS9SXZ8_9ACTN|nr:hypothetical protein [Streptomyces marispadix]MCH6161142.1 hypothetical protein [Streptomyces marispadix]
MSILAAASVTAVAPLLLVTGCTDDTTAAASDRKPLGTYGGSGATLPSGAPAAHGAAAASGQPSGVSGRAGASGRSASAGFRFPSDPREAVRSAAAALVEYGTSRARTSMAMASGGTRIAVEGEGGFDYRRGKGRLTVRLPEGTSGARPGERRTVTELLVPRALYMKNRGAGVPAGKWVRVATDELPDGNLISAGATDPGSAAELLRGARETTYDGKATTSGGTVVRRYHGTLDLAAAAREASPRRRGELEAAARGFSHGTVPFDAQIDGQGRLRKVRHQFTFAGGAPSGTDGTKSQAAGGSGNGVGRGGRDRSDVRDNEVAVAATTWFYGYGVPVKVAMPGPDDIYAGKIAPF